MCMHMVYSTTVTFSPQHLPEPTMPAWSAPPPCTQQHHELQGPRPAQLRVKRASHKIKKSPVQARQPVIIYVESPQVIHASPTEFMSVVQRLTGAPPSTTFSASILPPPVRTHGALPLVASTGRPLVSGSSFVSLPAGDADAAGRDHLGLSFFNSELSPAFLFYQNTESFGGVMM